MLSDFVRRNPAWEGTNELTVPTRDKKVKSFIRGNQFRKESRYCCVRRELVCNGGWFVLQEGHIINNTHKNINTTV